LGYNPESSGRAWKWWNQSHRYKEFQADRKMPFELKSLTNNTILSLTGLFVDRIIGGCSIGYTLSEDEWEFFGDARLIERISEWELMLKYDTWPMMPVPFGFSVGDCISICLLIKDTIKALDSAHGSASEYQAVTRELSTLDRALLEVLNLQENAEFGYTRELIALGLTVKSAVEGCRECLEGFLGRIGRYERTLGNGIDGSDSKGGFGEEYDTDDKGKRAVKYNWRVAKAKVTWALGKSPDLAKFRAEINAHCSTINMLLLTANL
jgi:hypothetical protein